MTPVQSYFVTAFISLFAIIDAIGNAPVFLSLTPRNTSAERTAMALKTSMAAFVILTTFAILGNKIFTSFGITIDAFRITGGLILLKIAMDMVEVKSPRSRHTPEEDQENIGRDDVAIIPMAIPMLSGPGAISTVVVLAAQAGTSAHWGVLLAAIGLNTVLVYLILRSSARVVVLLGETGMKVLTRILGIILASLSVQFILTGVRNALGMA
ncbi:MAG TPA: MarC family protein [Nitrospiria bacterium]